MWVCVDDMLCHGDPCRGVCCVCKDFAEECDSEGLESFREVPEVEPSACFGGLESLIFDLDFPLVFAWREP